MTTTDAITPEILYYFDTEPKPNQIFGTNKAEEARPAKPSLSFRIRHAFFSGLVKMCFLAVTLSTPLAAPVDVTIPQAETPVRGADTLKAQLNALQGGLENLRRLRRFFDDAKITEASVLARAQHLIETMPAHEDAGAAAWRIAAVASLTIDAGTLADVDVDKGYRLAHGAVGWDFGPEGSQVQAGFTPVTPSSLGAKSPATGGDGATPLTDGIAALKAFRGSLPNGLYRVLIMRDASDVVEDVPFGGEITVNGATIDRYDTSKRNRLRLTGDSGQMVGKDGNSIRGTDTGLGVQAWAIVDKGELQIDFAALPAGRMITAIIAEPFDIDKLELQPAVLEKLAEALGGIVPAAGPEARALRRGSRTVRRFADNAISQFSASTPLTETARKAPRAIAASASGGSFAASRRLVGSSAAPATAVPTAEETQTALLSTSFSEDDTPAFEDREILVKRSVRIGDDSEGLAADLNSMLDDATLSGTFLCATEPCEEVLPVSPEPDLAAAFLLLGDWLEDPENLTEDWTSLEAVLNARETGSEIAIVYAFDVDAAGLTDVELRAIAGSGIFVWLDGDFVFGATENGPFVDALDFEYSIDLPDLSSGEHFLQILSESHVDKQGFALELRGTPLGEANVASITVREPGSLLLFGIGLVGLGFMGRQRFA